MLLPDFSRLSFHTDGAGMSSAGNALLDESDEGPLGLLKALIAAHGEPVVNVDIYSPHLARRKELIESGANLFDLSQYMLGSVEGSELKRNERLAQRMLRVGKFIVQFSIFPNDAQADRLLAHNVQTLLPDIGDLVTSAFADLMRKDSTEYAASPNTESIFLRGPTFVGNRLGFVLKDFAEDVMKSNLFDEAYFLHSLGQRLAQALRERGDLVLRRHPDSDPAEAGDESFHPFATESKLQIDDGHVVNYEFENYSALAAAMQGRLYLLHHDTFAETFRMGKDVFDEDEFWVNPYLHLNFKMGAPPFTMLRRVSKRLDGEVKAMRPRT